MRTNRKSIAAALDPATVPQSFIEKVKASISSYNLQEAGDHSEYAQSKSVGPKTRICGEGVVTGGASGGSCYGTNAESYTVPDPHPTLDVLDSLLEEIAPTITFLQYKKLIGSLPTDTVAYDGGSDYYGNYTDYERRYVSIQDLYEALIEQHLIPEEKVSDW